MTTFDSTTQLRAIEKYISELETARRKLAVENAQLRTSHSYRLGRAFVQFFKRPRPRAILTLVRDVRDAMRPLTSPAPHWPKRPFGAFLSAYRAHPDSFRKIVEELPVGSEIEKRIHGLGARVVGIIGAEVQARLGDCVTKSSLAYDRYETEWTKSTHLVVDVDHLSVSFGWEHAFTLCDPAATVEMIAMLHKAREAGMRTVLIEPSQSYRYQLLSRARPLFDLALASENVTPESLDMAGLR